MPATIRLRTLWAAALLFPATPGITYHRVPADPWSKPAFHDAMRKL